VQSDMTSKHGIFGRQRSFIDIYCMLPNLMLSHTKSIAQNTLHL